MNLEEMKAIIPVHTSGHFATVDGDKADVRGWQYQLIEDGRIYFCTSNKKNVYRQLESNPNCAFTCSAGGYNFRISGKAVMVTDEELTAKIHATIDKQVAAVYPAPDANGFTVFYLEHGEVKYSNNFMTYDSFTY
ncbi:Uncharacterized protein, pyridoxamine 5'-phosphate oxidase (PNPOx-like) family [Anaerocolumna jejuensis DSM 15929]|uniref:Uncharacterized protein, pyridoxamine 5'-phosphate oxidase (PNPOx-like) family n=1 Tax=Anaerocolumna jejuensis DSM 15929 TaxID=1121322 RepID=A0A1M6Q1P6_9FIRM|nr:pyridoxamine 5'-phosphate oxidase family protein [Anaerocolumna jejuensis]SHK14093.1 Uncharacterized protein, pyridoxamine 5'-phosphate oxidase (PNPOx-like) family [Anaerocolumna jejuensis DSM 15929]